MSTPPDPPVSSDLSAKSGDQSGKTGEQDKESVNKDRQTSGDPSKENNVEGTKESNVSESKMTKDPEIVAFSPESKMNWTPWLKYFDSICVEHKKDDVWKIRNIQKYLKDSALTLYINNCLHVLHWFELVNLFNEHYSVPDALSLTDFSQIRYKFGEDLNDYYHKKTRVGRTLGLDPKLILEGLTDGLPLEMQKLVVANAPPNTNEWRELVFRLNKLKLEKKENESKIEQNSQNIPQYRQWRPFRPPVESGQNANRSWNYRVPYQTPQFRPFQTNQSRNQQPQLRPTSNYQTRPNIHHQATLPPSPCKICFNIGIPNAYHWMKNCPFWQQTLTAPTFTPNNTFSNPNPDQLTHESSPSTNSNQ